jgi:hypothetical protein
MFLQFLSAVLNVKDAFTLHSLHIADSFLTFSQRGISSVMFCHFPRKNVPCSDDIITIFCKLAAFSANGAISLKN